MTDDCCLLLEQVKHSALIMRLKREGCHSSDFSLQHTRVQLLTASNSVYVQEMSELTITKSFREAYIKGSVHD